MKAPTGSLLTIGYGTTVAMWSMGYLGRLPSVVLPSPVMLSLLLFCVLGGGFVAGRHLGTRLRTIASAGAITGTLNLLVLGSFLGGSRPLGTAVSSQVTGALVGGRLRGQEPLDMTAVSSQVTVGGRLRGLGGHLAGSSQVTGAPNRMGKLQLLLDLLGGGGPI